MVKTATAVRRRQLQLYVIVVPDGIIITFLHFGDWLTPSLIVHGHESNIEVFIVIEHTE